jgi:hypothetical protein
MMKGSAPLLLIVSTAAGIIMAFLFAGCRAQDDVILAGHKVFAKHVLPLPYTYISQGEIPRAFSWHNVNGRSYLTRSLNQHIPQ